jgi:acetoin utilization deacetylase AcuC-like enzyme
LHRYKSPESDAASAVDKCDWIVESLKERRTKASQRVKVFEEQFMFPCTALTLGENILGAVHDLAYVRAVESGEPRSLVESLGQPWSGCVFHRAVEYAYTLRRAVGEVDGTQRDGSSIRIVGSLGGSMHHARRACARFGSTFNGLVAAAQSLFSNGKAAGERAVLILDLDGSCGGGTAEMIAGMNRVRLIDIAVNDRDAYANTENASLQIVASAGEYLDRLRSALHSLDVAKEQNPVCIYSAGVDGFEGMDGGLGGMTAEVLAERDRMVFAWCRSVGLRTAYTLGGGEECGGCPRETLVALHRQTIEAAAMEASRK